VVVRGTAGNENENPTEGPNTTKRSNLNRAQKIPLTGSDLEI